MKKKIYYNHKETNYSVAEDGKVFNDKTGRELKGTLTRNEYRSVQLVIEGKPKTFMVHRLVAEAFCENPNEYTIVDHIDRDKLNNHYTNLRWTTSSGNSLNRDKKENRENKTLTEEAYNREEWKEIASNKNYLVNSNGQVINKEKMRYLLGSPRNGYIRVSLQGKMYSVHRLVWEAFNGEIPEGMVIDHINGNRGDNRLENLRIVSQKENMKNAQINGHKCQKSVKQYDRQGNFIKEYRSFKEAADEIGVTPPAISSASKRLGTCKDYFWITGEQDITIEYLIKNTVANEQKKTAMGVSKYSKEGLLLKHYNSLGEAGKDNNCATSTIKRAADSKRLGKGYYWILDD